MFAFGMKVDKKMFESCINIVKRLESRHFPRYNEITKWYKIIKVQDLLIFAPFGAVENQRSTRIIQDVRRQDA